MKVKMILPALTEATSPSGGRLNTRCFRRSASPHSPAIWKMTSMWKSKMSTSKLST